MAVDYNSRAVLGWIGGRAVTGALCAAFIYFTPISKSAPPSIGVEAQPSGFAAPSKPPVSVGAQSGGAIVSGSVSGMAITLGGAPNGAGPIQG